MSEPDFESLFWDAADDPDSAELRERVEAFLTAHPEARAELAELDRLQELLTSARQDVVEPPAALGGAIRQGLASRATYRPRPSLASRLRKLFQAPLQVRLAYGVLGALLAVAGLQLATLGDSPPEANLVGTAGLEPEDALMLSLPKSAGTLRLRPSAGRLEVEFEPGGNGTVRLAFWRSGGPLQLAEISSDAEWDGQPGRVTVDARQALRLTLTAGEPLAAPVTVTAATADAQIVTLEVTVAPSATNFSRPRG